MSRKLARCIIEKLTKENTPQSWTGKTTYQQQQQLETYARQYSNTVSGTPSETDQQAVLFGNLGWKAYEGGNVDKAIEFSKKALAYLNKLSYIKFNLVFFYLLQKDEATATNH